MTAQDRVYSCFPDAEARQEPPIYEHGIDMPIAGGYWAIFAGPDSTPRNLDGAEVRPRPGLTRRASEAIRPPERAGPGRWPRRRGWIVRTKEGLIRGWIHCRDFTVAAVIIGGL